MAHEKWEATQRQQRALSDMLSQLPNLRELSLMALPARHLRAPGQRHRQATPYFPVQAPEPAIAPLVNLAMPVLGEQCQIESLDVSGPMDASDLIHYPSIPSVTTLRIQSMRVHAGTQAGAMRFLSCFPNVRWAALELRSYSVYSVLLLDGFRWPQLSSLALYGLWTTEPALLSFLERHELLGALHLQDISLALGSWKRVLERIRSEHPRVRVSLGGTLAALAATP